jgi:hypothetical protein
MIATTQRLVDVDWLDPWPDGQYLHHATVPDNRDETFWPPLRLDCGWVTAVVIPGVFTRMSARRCAACCAINGLPRGRGSPKNDPNCRAILGLIGDTA